MTDQPFWVGIQPTTSEYRNANLLEAVNKIQIVEGVTKSIIKRTDYHWTVVLRNGREVQWYPTTQKWTWPNSGKNRGGFPKMTTRQGDPMRFARWCAAEGRKPR